MLKTEHEAIAHAYHQSVANIGRERGELDSREVSELRAVESRVSAEMSQLTQQRAQIDRSEQAELQQLGTVIRRNHVAYALQNARVSSASISGFGVKMKATLQAYGITTAADIDNRIYHISGIGPSKAATLFAWRHSIETYAQSTAPSPTGSDVSALRLRFSAARQPITQRLNDLQQSLLPEDQGLLGHARGIRDRGIRVHISSHSHPASLTIRRSRRNVGRRKVQSVSFLIDETPYCVWDWELGKLDREFCDGINPSYFAYMAEVNVAELDGDHAQQAAMALRMTYSHAQETLMSLLCATVQAPNCVVGWLHKYRNEELDKVVAKIHHCQPVITKFKNPDISWPGLADAVHRYISLPDKTKEGRIKSGFEHLWSRTASEFLSDGARREYNSIKHGLRARSGGFTLVAGIEAVRGTPCAPEEMKTVGGSEFGSTYYVPEPVEGVEKCNIKVTSASRNWLPEMIAGRINLMSMSMRNVLSYLKVINGGKPAETEFVWPHDLDAFDEVWKYSPGVTDCSFTIPLTAADIDPQSKKQIVDRCTRAGHLETE